MFFVGDSIMAGAWDNKGGWVNRLIGNIMDKFIEANNNNGEFCCLPYNLGVFGNTIPDVLERMEREIEVRLESSKTALIVFLIGTNDSIYLVNEDKPLFTEDEFRNNLIKLITISKKTTENMIFIGMPPVDDALVNPMPWDEAEAYRNERVESFDEIIQEVCSEQKIPFCPMFDKWMALDNYKEYLQDGAHPNSKGHAFIAEQVHEFLSKKEYADFY